MSRLYLFFCLIFFVVENSNCTVVDSFPGFYEKIASVGFDSTSVIDMSDNSAIDIADIPDCAYINICGVEDLPQTKTESLFAWFVCYDGQGSYFKKRVVLKVQGNSSIQWPKKNFSVSFFEKDWNSDLTTKFTIGNWVEQDAFHFKAFYTDYFKGGVAMTGYKVYGDMITSHDKFQDRSGVVKASKKATCFPDGFPCKVYLNGNFYGMYVWQLKKHRKNMDMDKDNPYHIHLDGTLSSVFQNSIDWTAFEVRNPKGLCSFVTKDEDDGVAIESEGNIQKYSLVDYNGDNPTELLGVDNDLFNPSDEKHIMSAKVKQCILRLNGYYKELDSLEKVLSPEEMKVEIAKRYDVVSCVDYLVLALVINNADGFNKNSQWFTYDGYKWFVAPYDLDVTFGCSWHSKYLSPPQYSWLQHDYTMNYFTGRVPYRWFIRYYFDEIKKRYAELRNSGVLSVDRVFEYVWEWYDRVGGQSAYDEEYSKWNKSYCNSTTICGKNWTTSDDWTGYNKLSVYDSSKEYLKGDRCVSNYRIWTATANTKGVTPFKKLGFTDSLSRVRSWIERRLELEDVYLDYSSPLEGDTLLTEFENRISSLNIDKKTLRNKSSLQKISLKEPRCAFINIISEKGLPSTKGEELPAYLEFHDNNGSYFKKKVIFAQQGSDDKNSVKQNFGLTFCEDDWIGESTTDLKFGKWVAQDEFHLKAFYGDAFCGSSVIANKLYGQMIEVDSAALTRPDAFPCVVYVNGSFHGVYAWQLKKQRKNMDLAKDDGNAVWLDGTLNDKQLFQGSVNWKKFEVRNPKTLYTMDGAEYDGDNPQELMDETSEAYVGKKKQVQCALAKQHIQELANYYGQLAELEKNGASADVMRKAVAERFDVERLIQYMLFSLVTNNYDGFSKNWQWFTTDGKIWTVAPYDCSLTFGYNEGGTELWPASQSSKKYDYRMLNADSNGPMLWIKKYFWENLRSVYASYRNSGVISVENIMSVANDWVDRKYAEDLANETNKWGVGFSFTDSLARLQNWVTERIALEDAYLLYTKHSVDAVAEHGTVSGSGTYLYGDTVALTAKPKTGYHFEKWSNGELNDTVSLVLTSDTVLTAYFAANEYTVDAVAEHGTVSGSGTYLYGDTVALTAKTETGYHFEKWSNGELNDTVSLVLTSDTVLTAYFAANEYTVDAVAEHGTVSGSGTYLYGDTVTLSVKADVGYRFVKWSNKSKKEKISFVVLSDTVFTASFKAINYTVDAVADNGYVVGTGTYTYGDSVVLVAVPNEGFKFVEWSNGEKTDSLSFVVSEDVNLEALFSEIMASPVVFSDPLKTSPYVYDVKGRVLYRREELQSGIVKGVYIMDSKKYLKLK